jgi:hypothetical protein
MVIVINLQLLGSSVIQLALPFLGYSNVYVVIYSMEPSVCLCGRCSVAHLSSHAVGSI